MSTTIQKSSSGATFSVLKTGQVVKDYAVNDFRFIPNEDGIHFSMISKYQVIYIIDNAAYTDTINGDTGIAFASFAALRTYVLTNFFRKPGGSAGSTSQNTGTALAFTGDAVYGTTASPETGNITGVVTGAALGASVLLIHNNGSAPTFDGKFHKLSGSGTYVTGSINYIYCQYIDDTHILYSISQ